MLHQQDGFDRCFPMSLQELVDKFLVKLPGNDFGSVAFPPIGFIRAMMQTDPAELARIGENKRAVALKQSEMIVLDGSIIRGLDPDLAGHAEMNSKPAPNVFASPDGFGVVAGKFKKHPFSARVRAEKFRAD